MSFIFFLLHHLVMWLNWADRFSVTRSLENLVNNRHILCTSTGRKLFHFYYKKKTPITLCIFENIFFPSSTIGYYIYAKRNVLIILMTSILFFLGRHIEHHMKRKKKIYCVITFNFTFSHLEIEIKHLIEYI